MKVSVKNSPSIRFDGGWKNCCNKESSGWSSIMTEALKGLKARIKAKIQRHKPFTVCRLIKLPIFFTFASTLALRPLDTTDDRSEDFLM